MLCWRMGITDSEQRINETLSQLYFERWGLLAPPSGKASFFEGYATRFPIPIYNSSTLRGVQDRRSGVQACKKLCYVPMEKGQVMCLPNTHQPKNG